MKKTLLTLIAALLLGGVANAQNYWGDDPDSHAQPSNTPIVASVGTLDGVAATITDDCRLGAFVGDELRGIAAPHTDGKFWIQVFYTATTDNITFKFYDGTTEYATCANLPLTGSDEGYGTPGDPVVLNFTNGQTVELAEGWNWWSTNMEITLDDLKEALVDADGNSGMKIVADDTKSITYNGTSWRGNLSTLDVTRFYKVYVTTDCEITLTGSPINLATHPVTIVHGYNWIGFPLNEVRTISNVFSGFAISGDRVTSGDTKSTTFNGTNWRGNLTSLNPGQGYIYYSNSLDNRTFTFPTGNQ